MSKYIGTPVVNVSVDTVDVTGDITTTDTTPEVIIVNNTHEDTDGGREGKVTFKGQQSGGEETTLAQIQASHDGTSDDEKGDLIFKTNDGSDGASPTERMRIDSAGDVGIGAAPLYGRLHIFDDNSDIAMDANASGQLHVDGNGYAFGVALNASGAQLYTNSASRDLIFGTNETERMRITDGKVGIGDDSPDNHLNVKESALSGRSASNGNTSMTLEHATDTGIQFFSANQTQIRFGDAASTGAGSIIYAHSDDSLRTSVNGSEAMRIQSTGRLLIGKTSGSRTSAGCEFNQSGFTRFTAASDKAFEVVRTGSDGELIEFFNDSTHTGSLGVNGDRTYLSVPGHGIALDASGNSVLPCTDTGGNLDNNVDIGASSARYDDVFATNGTIQTSDRNEKQDIEDLSEAELRVATAAKGLIKKYRWIDAVQEKGDDARIHVGIIAQDLQAAFEAEGLDAGRYAMFISDTWWEADRVVPAVEANEEEGIEAVAEHTVTDTFDTQEEAPEGATERTRLGVRYPELLAFIIGAM